MDRHEGGPCGGRGVDRHEGEGEGVDEGGRCGERGMRGLVPRT